MTDNEIIKALENCADGSGTGLIRATLDFINRQKAEIAEYQKHIDNDIIYVKSVKAEAIKEFAEKLKESAFDCDVSFGYGREHYEKAVAVVEIDNLIKEMTD